MGREVLPRSCTRADAFAATGAGVGNQIQRGYEGGELAVQLRVGRLGVVHVLYCDAGQIECGVVEVVGGAVARDIGGAAERAYDLEDARAPVAADAKFADINEAAVAAQAEVSAQRQQ